jgi:DNA-binding transcriptional ArsR family regulator
MSEDEVKRPRHLGEIKRLDEQTRVSDLPATAAAHKASKLLLSGPSLPRRLLLQGAEGSKLSLSVNDLFHGGRTECPDQLVLQICDAHVETQPFHSDPSEVGAEAGPLEAVPEVCLLRGVAETGQPDIKPLRAEQAEEPSYGLRTPNRHDGNALSVEVPATALGKRFDGARVADPLNEHDRTRVAACDGCEKPLLVHSLHPHTQRARGRRRSSRGCAILNPMVQYSQVDRTLAALADPTRRGVLERLGGGSATITELAEPFGISLTGIRKHVRVLEDVELVATEKVGRTRRCSLGPRRLEDVQEWIETYRRMLDERLDRFEALLERTKGVPE